MHKAIFFYSNLTRQREKSEFETDSLELRWAAHIILMQILVLRRTKFSTSH